MDEWTDALRSVLAKIALALGSAFVTLVGVDVALLVIQGPVRVVENFYEPARDYGYKMQPNLTFEFANPYHGYRGTVHTNALGLRGRAVTVPKPAGVTRILFIGDSMTAGLEVNDDDTFAAVCGRLLGGAPRVETVNAGVRGYNLDNILAFLQDVGLGLEPDVVVYTFVDNDLTANRDFSPETSDWSRGLTLSGLAGRIAAYSHLAYRFDLLQQQIALRRQTDNKPNERVYVPRGLFTLFTTAEYATDQSSVVTAQRIAYMDSLCRARGARFVLAGAPHRLEISPTAQTWLQEQLGTRATPDFDGVRHYLDWAAARAGCGRVDPIPEFRAGLAHDRDYWFHKDDHLNVRGHRLFGEIMAAKLRPLLPAASGRR
jgi:lysophospholipase L1-like esterase